MKVSQAKERESSREEKPHRTEFSPTGKPQVIVVKGLCFGLYNLHGSCYDGDNKDQSTHRHLPSKPVLVALSVFTT